LTLAHPGQKNAMNEIDPDPESKHYRSIWISDVHLGTRGCKADYLLDFLKYTRSDYLYLVGDIIDGWRLKHSWYWPQKHNDVVQKLLRKARKGTKVVYVPGNHDEFAREYLDNSFGQIEVVGESVHETVDGKRLLVIHGDEFDCVVRYARWLAFVGDRAYSLAIAVNNWFNWARRHLGYPYWSLSAFLKYRVKNAVKYIDDFERSLATAARKRRADGVICGHIHHPEVRHIDGVLYANCGDWVESCSALVEHADGRMEILFWMEQPRVSLSNSQMAA
jgi:UDP-2,3-diacylglucosamine pyrophosphatase LpxH